MSRNLFISFLGSTYYQACNYVREEFKCENTRFIQIATMKYLKVDEWSEKDSVRIFVTKGENGSYIKNWLNGGHGDKNTKGLESEINKLNIKADVKPVIVDDGNNEKEIWDIFNKLYEEIRTGDKLYIDITHGFRYLPMMFIVFVNYCKVLKNVEVVRITYGNFEARTNSYAPIIDITTFSQLQDWTNAANLFVNHGSTKMISDLIDYDELKSNLILFSDIYSTVRGKDLFKGEVAVNLKKQISEIKNEISPFEPIKKQLISKLSEYETGNIIKNGMSAIKYCIDFNLTQQGITLLSEFVITYILIFIDEDWEDKINRDTVSGCLNINSKEQYEYRYFKKKSINDNATEVNNENIVEQEKRIVEKVFKLHFKKQISDILYKKISQGNRNDINHAGIRSSPKEAAYLKDRLNKYYNLLNEIIIKENANKPK
ncbi:MAG: hypothetical protein Kow0068_17420 [Marinilabiliales bacterium]